MQPNLEYHNCYSTSNIRYATKKICFRSSVEIWAYSKKNIDHTFCACFVGCNCCRRENVISYFAQAGLITLVLNVVMMVVAYYVAKLFVSGMKQKKCITIECGLQNGTLAIFVATSIFGGGMYVIPAATYSLIMFVTSLIFVYLVRKTV